MLAPSGWHVCFGAIELALIGWHLQIGTIALAPLSWHEKDWHLWHWLILGASHGIGVALSKHQLLVSLPQRQICSESCRL